VPLLGVPKGLLVFEGGLDIVDIVHRVFRVVDDDVLPVQNLDKIGRRGGLLDVKDLFGIVVDFALGGDSVSAIPNRDKACGNNVVHNFLLGVLSENKACLVVPLRIKLAVWLQNEVLVVLIYRLGVLSRMLFGHTIVIQYDAHALVGALDSAIGEAGERLTVGRKVIRNGFDCLGGGCVRTNPLCLRRITAIRIQDAKRDLIGAHVAALLEKSGRVILELVEGGRKVKAQTEAKVVLLDVRAQLFQLDFLRSSDNSGILVLIQRGNREGDDVHAYMVPEEAEIVPVQENAGSLHLDVLKGVAHQLHEQPEVGQELPVLLRLGVTCKHDCVAAIVTSKLQPL